MNIYEKAIYTLGLERQLIKLAEECGELVQACCKQSLYNNVYDNLIEEMADVTVLIRQMKEYYKCHAEFDERIKYKLDRLSKKINLSE